MGKTGKWLKSFLTGKKDKEKEKDKHKEKENCVSNHNSSTPPVENQNPTTPIATRPTTPKEKRRWSFRRSSATASAPKDLNHAEQAVSPQPMSKTTLESKNEQKKTDVTVVETTNVISETIEEVQSTEADNGITNAIEVAAAIKVQSVFRSYLARKALRALKGLVKLQALVRGHLVRRQATATLRCMQALVTVQARVRAQRLRMVEESKYSNHRQSSHRKSTQDNRLRDSYQDMEENIKIVEMDLGESKGSSKSRSSYSNYPQHERLDHRCSTHYQDNCQVSPAPSPLTDMSPRGCSGHFEDYSFSTAQSSPQYYSAISKPDSSTIPFSFPRQDYGESLSYDYPLFPNYMANTKSSRAKARSQSAPKSRPDSFERQLSRRRASVEGRNIPRAMRMQRSSSHVGASAQNYQYPWSVRLDKSTVSLKDSECGSTSTVLTNVTYCRSLAGYDPRGTRY